MRFENSQCDLKNEIWKQLVCNEWLIVCLFRNELFVYLVMYWFIVSWIIGAWNYGKDY